MDMVTRYMRAVGAFLPQAQRVDIVNELTEDVRSQIEDKEEELGRPLTDAEVEAILTRSGPPLQVASRYLPQRWLIGPALLPSYFLVLKIVLAALIGAFFLVLLPVRVFQGASLLEALIQSISTLWIAIWIPIGIVTVIFAAIEWSQAPRSWTAGQLPNGRETADANVITRSEPIVQAALTTVFVLWWISGASFPVLNDVPLWQTLTHEVYWPVLLLSLGGTALAVANIVRPYWTPLRLGVRAALDGLGAVVAFIILNAERAQVTADVTTATNEAASSVARVTAGVGLSIAITLAIVGVVGVLSCVSYLIRCVRLAAQQR